jgi:hypothetical protein
MLSTKAASRAPVPEPRSGEALELQPLDPEDDREKERVRIRGVLQIAAGVTSLAVAVVAVVAFYRYLGPVFATESQGTTAALPQNDAEQGVSVPQTLDVSSGLVIPVPEPPKVSVAARQEPKQPEPELPQSVRVPLPVASSPPSLDGRLKKRAEGLDESPNKTASWDKVDTLKRQGDAKQQGTAERQVPEGTPPLVKSEDAGNAIQLRETKETIAQMKTLIGRGDFLSAANKAADFLEKGLVETTLKSSEYRELLELRRSAIEKYFRSPFPVRRAPQRTGDLEIAASEYDLMDAYVHADEAAIAREHFVNAERGYEQAISAARQREQVRPDDAKRELQEIKDNLGYLYARWAEYTQDSDILRRAEAAFQESEQLLHFAKDRRSAEKRLTDGRAWIKRTQKRLP